MSELPAEVTADVLSRLPVKSLLRFRCVSRPWCALIDSKHFIKSHLNRSIEASSTNLSIILVYGNDIYSMDFDSFDRAIKLNHPLESTHNLKVLGSCNGLLCLSETEDEHIVLWNPWTRKHQKIPVSPIEFPGKLPVGPIGFPRKLPYLSPFAPPAPRIFGTCEFIVYGFGYDCVSDDYKLVRMVQFFGYSVNSFYSEVKVYSLKANSWRRIQGFPYYLRHHGVNGVLVSGALHWVVSPRAKSNSADMIAAFDLGVEKYRLLPGSDRMTVYNDYHMNVRVLGGCLCLICHYDGEVDIWVMKEYGVKESWTKLFSVELRSVFRCSVSVRPLVYSKSGGEVLLAHDNIKLLWFDLKRKTFKNAWIHGVPSSFEAEICLGSLVPLPSDGGCDGKKQQAQKKKDRKERDDFLSKGFKLAL
ncbi:F-box protein CPR1-like [Cornus florida]|uniref:F-box protein CPR1-like n=1 Tax=Cornus florida TaxID=4283 RepID=UPI0028A1F1F6|nr:F-box protein CPR1-like [Cornus florida]XP_059631105.1 F-box protein CPR1-like [Cornus florida]XP_059631106.1 F-box protein CPR1-like [Cornus florida]